MSRFSFPAYISAVHIILKARDATINPCTADELFLPISDDKNGNKNEKTCRALK